MNAYPAVIINSFVYRLGFSSFRQATELRIGPPGIISHGESEFIETYRFELERDPLFFTYSILVIIAGIVIIGFSAGFSAKKPKGF